MNVILEVFRYSILNKLKGRCVICGGPGISDAYYCKECVQLEKDVRYNEFKLK